MHVGVPSRFKTGGIIRVAVPDLERIVPLYLEWFERAANGAHVAQVS